MGGADGDAFKLYYKGSVLHIVQRKQHGHASMAHHAHTS